MAGVFCFSRNWRHSSFFATLVVFLIFFGEDFSFVPGLLFHEGGDWSVKYFGLPTTFSLFQSNPMLPGLGLLFWGLFSLQKYYHDQGGAWCFLAALLFAASVEVKIFIALQILVSLALAAVVYLVLFRKTNLLKVGIVTGGLLVPVLLTIFLQHKAEDNLAISFNPWPYVSNSMEALHLKERLRNKGAFLCLALPLYFIGSFGLRIIGAPAIGRSLLRPGRDEALRFYLASFVLLGVLLTLTLRIVPLDSTHPYNNSVWFFGQGKHIAWIFAAEALVGVCNFLAKRRVTVALSYSAIALVTIALTVPSAVQHFVVATQPEKRHSRIYGKEILEVTAFLTKNIKPGDVVLPCAEFLAPVQALVPARVPIGYFANTFVAQEKYRERLQAQAQFWQMWQKGRIQMDYLANTRVRYVILRKRPEPTPVPGFVEIFHNDAYSVFEVRGTDIRAKPA